MSGGGPCASPWRPPEAIAALRHWGRPGGALALVLAAALLAQAPAERSAPLPLPLQANQPILAADVRLRQQGWRPGSEQTPSAFERELAGNALASLAACSGTGAGFCRYDYRRGPQRLVLITVPGAQARAGVGDGRVLRWQLESAPLP